MSDPAAFDAKAFADVGLKALRLPEDPAFRPGIEANLTIAFRLADVLLTFPLPDESEPAAVFDPLADPDGELAP